VPPAESGDPDWVAATLAGLLADGFAGAASAAASMASGVGAVVGQVVGDVFWPPARDRLAGVRELVCSPIAALDADALAVAGVASMVASMAVFSTMAAAIGCDGSAATAALVVVPPVSA
jgi:hypothetical protein